MAGKAMVYGNPALRQAVANLSKNALADIVIDRLLAEIGEAATPAQIATALQGWVDPVLRLRGDSPVNIAGLMLLWLQQSERHIARLNPDDLSPEMQKHRDLIQSQIAEFKRHALTGGT